MFYNTTNLSGDQLREAIANANNQDARILQIFSSNPGIEMTPIEVHEKSGEDMLLTSVRRALSNLTKHGYLVKTNKKSQEKYGKPNYMWTLSPEILN